MDIDHQQFRQRLHELADWIADFRENVQDYPVKAQVDPGFLLKALPESAPESSEEFELIFRDFINLVMPGMTHWQHPGFYAYFPSNASRISLLAEMLISALGAQCMIWDTSPAAAELEQRMMEWLREMLGLPRDWEGVIQDTASTATLVALLCARERATGWRINEEGFSDDDTLRIYASAETHSSIEKAVKIAGFGRNNLVKVPVDQNLAMIPSDLEQLLNDDLALGLKPCAVVSTIGTTGTTAVDPLQPVGELCRNHGLWLHVDAAYAGSALILPEFAHHGEGMELADSFVFNPHKWLFTHFDCTAYFVRDSDALLRTLSILPEYLKTGSRGSVRDYRDWGIPLGRRFRALKLWFVIRHFGREGLQRELRRHIGLAEKLESWILQEPDFEIVIPRNFNLVVFRFRPAGISEQAAEELNLKLLTSLNASGELYLTHTRVGGKYVLRIVTAQTDLDETFLRQSWKMILQQARELVATVN